MFEGVYEVKVLGTPIGGSSDIPIDGDGDNRYTLFPGAGDVTPLPPEGINVVELAKKVREQIAQIDKKVTDKYGPLKKKKDVVRALNRAFPNANIEEFIDMRKDRNGDIEDRFRSIVVGLLHESIDNPERAKNIYFISYGGVLRQNANDIYGAAAGFTYNGEQYGMVMDFFAVLADMPKMSEKDLSHPQIGFGEKAVYALQQTGASPELVNHVMRVSTTIHEMAHIRHYGAIWDELGIDSDGQFSNPLQVLTNAGFSKEEIKDLYGDAQNELEALARDAGADVAGLSPREQLALMTRIVFTTHEAEIQQRARSKWGYDKLQGSDAMDAEQQMARVSKYAQANIFEAFAEFETGKALVGENPVPSDGKVNQMVDWIGKKSLSEDLEDRIGPKKPTVFRICTGTRAYAKPSEVPKADPSVVPQIN